MDQDTQFYRGLLDNVADGVYFVDPDRKILFWNKAAERITGFKKEDVVGSHCWDDLLRHVDNEGCNLCTDGCPLAKTIADGQSREAVVYLHHKEGYRLPVYIRVVPINNSNGKITGAVETFTDLTSQNTTLQHIEELEKMAYLDHLTGLANRRYTEISLISRLDEVQRYGWSFGIIFMDIDHFKKINDVYGHALGDEVLKMVAQTLVKVSRTSDIVGRWGGEEFLSIIANANKEILLGTANRYRLLVEKSGLHIKTGNILVTLSGGATLVQHTDTKETIIKRVDELMYQSKAKGGNCMVID